MNTLLDHCNKFDHEAIREYAIKTFAAQNIGRQIFEEYEKVLKKG